MRRILLASLVLVVGCQSPTTRLVPQHEDRREWAERERELSEKADKYHHALVKAELIVDDKALKAYLQERLDELLVASGMPPGEVRIGLVKNPYMNAAMLANGMIHLNIGILSRIHNEAELMTLLGHEFAHYLFRHGLREILYQDRQRTSRLVARVFAGIILLPTGLFPLAFDGLDKETLNSVVAPQVAGYSRELETDADRFAFSSMVIAGYDPSATSTFFELMLADAELLKQEINVENGHSRSDPYFYASHPDLVDRIALFSRLQAEHVRDCDRRKRRKKQPCRETPGRLGEDRYMSIIKATALENARLNLSIGRRMAATRIVNRLLDFHSEDAETWALLGELMSARGSRKEALPGALRALEYAVELDPNLAKAHRELGFLYRDLGRDSDAIDSFRRYLAADPEAEDRAIVERIVERAE